MQSPPSAWILVASIVLVGCGGDGGPDSQATATATAEGSDDADAGTSGIDPGSGDGSPGSSTSASTTSSDDDGTGTGSASASASASASDDADSGGVDEAGTTGEPEPDIPDNAYCAEVVRWDPGWAQLELDVLELVNEQRAAGASCGGQPFAPAAPLAMHPALRCAARKHSKDMVERNFFDHINPDGEAPEDRIAMAGYGGTLVGENIQGGGEAAADAMDWWMNSPPHCGNIMNPAYQWLGVGYHQGGQYGTTWTQTFGGP